jgi:hypothetical protein
MNRVGNGPNVGSLSIKGYFDRCVHNVTYLNKVSTFFVIVECVIDRGGY